MCIGRCPSSGASAYTGYRCDCGRPPAQPDESDDRFKGTSWCITGSFEHFKPREKAQNEIEKRGGRVVAAVSAKTDYLLVGEGGGGKRAKAEALGVTIIDEQRFLKMIKGEE